MLKENLIFNKNDIEVNLDKFESGENNILLVTGFSGSGKSTLADKLAAKYGCIHFLLDWFTSYIFGGEVTSPITKKDLEEEKEYGLLAYIEQENLKNNYTYDDFSGQEIIDQIRKYIKFLIEWCKKQTSEKFIIEGLQIYDTYKEGDIHITNCSMIIKGTSTLISTIRAAKRNTGNSLKNFWSLIKPAIKDNKNLNALEKDITAGKSFAEEFKEYDELWN